MPETAHIILASASPRRRELLGHIGVRFEPLPVDIDETPLSGEFPRDYVSRLALSKARAAQQRRKSALPILGADTAVVIDAKILGKPYDQADALAMLAMLSGREHRVLSAVAIVQGERQALAVNTSTVRFRPLSEAERRAYWETGEPADKAGAYAIQGIGAAFVSDLRGSHSGVMGLPLYETAELLRRFGIDIVSNV